MNTHPLYKTFEDLRKAAEEMYEYNDCGVKAITMVSHQSYKEAHRMAKVVGQRENRGGMRVRSILTTLAAMGLEWENYRLFWPCTLATVTRRIPPKGRFLVFVRGHVSAVVDGQVMDWAEGQKLNVLNVYEVKPQEPPETQRSNTQ